MEVITCHLGVPKGIFLNGAASQRVLAYANGQLASRLTERLRMNSKILNADHIQESVIVQLHEFTKVPGTVVTIRICRVCACFMNGQGEAVASEPVCREINEVIRLEYLGNNVFGLMEE